MIIRSIHDTPMQPMPTPQGGGVSMAVMVGKEDGAPHFSMRSFRVAPGASTPRHAHDYEHEVFVVAGRGTVLLGGAERPIGAGDVVYVPANHEHQFRASAEDDLGPADGLSFLCVVPVRRDCGEPVPGT